MIITQLMGGLVNQMFQYAAGRGLSLRKNTTLNLDVSGFANYGLHQGFELQRVFGDQFEIASLMSIRKVLGLQSHAIVRRVMSQNFFASFRDKGFIIEPHFCYWSGINDLTKDCYLSGYWQSEKYFGDIAPQIRTDFTFQLPLENQNSEIVKQINQVNAVGLHVRRGDYANNPKTTATHGLCSLDYYLLSIKRMADQVERPYFFIFSDDIAWVRNNLKINFPHQYVSHNHGLESYNDMRLMSVCKHQIIANSSFSWWGAWLNANTDKVVIAPQKWFSITTDTSDLIPPGWIKV